MGGLVDVVATLHGSKVTRPNNEAPVGYLLDRGWHLLCWREMVAGKNKGYAPYPLYPSLSGCCVTA
jgi:hypothetical protein